jgi:ATP-dependent helicase/DNAse subunit B
VTSSARNAPHTIAFTAHRQAIISSLNIQPETMESKSMLFRQIGKVESIYLKIVAIEIVNPKLVLSNVEASEIEFIEAQTRAVEARAALRWVKARIVRDGMKLSDVAILARDLEPYRPFLEEVAAEFGIPLRVVGGQPLNQNPAVSALMNLLSLPVNEFPRRAVLDVWRSPYFDFSGLGIDANSAATLDEISRTGKVSQGLSQWNEAFESVEKEKGAGR